MFLLCCLEVDVWDKVGVFCWLVCPHPLSDRELLESKKGDDLVGRCFFVWYGTRHSYSPKHEI